MIRTPNVCDCYGQWRNRATGGIPADSLAIRRDLNGAILLLVEGGSRGHAGDGALARRHGGVGACLKKW